MPAISATDLTLRYGSVQALDHVSFDVDAGEIFGILGPNGAGKTTTVEILEGYRRPDAGSARVLGLDPTRDADDLHRRIGVMLQEGGLQPGLRARELLRCYAAFYDRPHDPDDLLETVGLGAASATPVRRLSGGQAQRLSLACALVGRPELVFLDEPTSGMDPHARAVTWDLVLAQRASGATVVLTTHAMDEAEHLCDRLAVLVDGRIAAIGSPAELTRATARDAVRFGADAGLPVPELAHGLGLEAAAVSEVRPGEYLVRADATPAFLADLACWLRDRGVGLHRLDVGHRSLERAFLELTADDRTEDRRTAGEERP